MEIVLVIEVILGIAFISGHSLMELQRELLRSPRAAIRADHLEEAEEMLIERPDSRPPMRARVRPLPGRFAGR